MNKIEWKLLGLAAAKIIGFFALVVAIGAAISAAVIYLSGVTLLIGIMVFLVCLMIWIEYKSLLFKRGKIHHL